jgi:hypothetical protein
MSQIEKPVLAFGCATMVPLLVCVALFAPVLTTIALLVTCALYGLGRVLLGSREQADSDFDHDEEEFP